MSILDVVYCVESNLRGIYPNIAKYGKKRVVSGWVSDSALVDRYKSGSVGSINQLYKDAIELGAVESSLATVTSNGKWYYDSDTDTVYYFNDANNPNELDIEAGTDWSTLVDDMIIAASEDVRGIVGKPILKSRLRDKAYDSVIINGTAAIACEYLIKPHNSDLAQEVVSKYDNEEDANDLPKGKLQKVRDGQISLRNEITPALLGGFPYEASLNAATTGAINEIRGKASGNDVVLVEIVEGGNLVYGVPNTTVTYRVKGKDSQGLQNAELVSATIINGDYQSLAYGLSFRFDFGIASNPAIYTTGDKWYVDISKEPLDTHKPLNSIPIRANDGTGRGRDFF